MIDEAHSPAFPKSLNMLWTDTISMRLFGFLRDRTIQDRTDCGFAEENDERNVFIKRNLKNGNLNLFLLKFCSINFYSIKLISLFNRTFVLLT